MLAKPQHSHKLHFSGFPDPGTGAATIFRDEFDADLSGMAPYHMAGPHRRSFEQQIKVGGNAGRSFKVEPGSDIRDISDNAIAREIKAAKGDLRAFQNPTPWVSSFLCLRPRVRRHLVARICPGGEATDRQIRASGPNPNKRLNVAVTLLSHSSALCRRPRHSGDELDAGQFMGLEIRIKPGVGKFPCDTTQKRDISRLISMCYSV